MNAIVNNKSIKKLGNVTGSSQILAWRFDNPRVTPREPRLVVGQNGAFGVANGLRNAGAIKKRITTNEDARVLQILQQS